MKSAKVLFNVMSVICFIYGIVYIFSLVFIPIGIYCFVAAKRFSYKAEHMFDIYTVDNRIVKNYVIFSCVACFPLGILAIIPYILITNNNVKISGLKVSDEPSIVDVEDKYDEQISNDEVTVEPVAEVVETEEEKQEKFKKLQNFRDKGIITDEELEMAREQLFDNNKK